MATLTELVETCAATTGPDRPADLLGEGRESWSKDDFDCINTTIASHGGPCDKFDSVIL